MLNSRKRCFTAGPRPSLWGRSHPQEREHRESDMQQYRPSPTTADGASRPRGQASARRHSAGLDIVFLIVAAVVSIEALGRYPASAPRRSRGRWCSRCSSWCPTASSSPRPAARSPARAAYTSGAEGFRPARGGHRVAADVGHPARVGRRVHGVHRRGDLEHYVTAFEHGSFTDYAFKLVFIWLTVLAAIISLRHGKWIPNVGASSRSCSWSSSW